jgi:hypothetical protein
MCRSRLNTFWLFAAVSGAFMLAMSVPSVVTAQDCDVCAYDAPVHGFLGETELCTPENRAQNPSCRTCSTTPSGHIGCHAAPISTGNCSSHGGPSCEGLYEEELVFLLAQAAMGRASAERLAAVLQSDSRFSFNAARRALQAVNCQGAIVVHVQVDRRTSRALSIAVSDVSSARR